MKKIIYNLGIMIAIIASINTALAQCYTAPSGLWPSTTFNPVCGGAFATITAAGYAGEYSNVSLVAGNTYVFKSSVATDYITVDNNGAAPLVGVVGVSGTAGVTWVCSVTGTYRFYTHTNSACGTALISRTRSMSCSAPAAPSTNCTNTSAYGTATIDQTGAAVTISSCNYAGEYSTISGAVSGQILKFTSSATGDYITVRSGSSAGAVVAQGSTALQFTNTFTGTLYVHWNIANSCGSQSTCRATSVQLMNPPVCNAPSSLSNSNVTATNASISWSAASPAPTSGYDVYLSTSSTAPTSGSTILGTVTTAGANLNGLVGGTTYYVWVRSNCGGGITGTWTGFTSFTTLAAASINCTNTSSYGSATIDANGTAVIISTCNFAGEYSTISGAVSGQALSFTSSAAGDYITVRSGSSTGAVVAQGTTPLQFNNTYTGTLYANWNTANSCGTQSTCRTTQVQCTSCTPPPPPANDQCSGAISMSCGGQVTVNSVNATADAAGSNFCGTSIATPGVWYQIAGNGQDMTVSTVGLTSTDTKLMVFRGSCAGLTCVGGSDDFSGLQSQVSWSSVSGTTYYVLAAQFSGTGSFPMSLTCTTPFNPCASIPNISSCGASSTAFSIAAGNGLWTGMGTYSTPGQEKMFAFTPAVTATYPITVVNNGPSTWVDLFWKSNASGCNSAGWTFVNDISGTETWNVSFTAGTTYYILLDPESTSGATGSIQIGCPDSDGDGIADNVDACPTVAGIAALNGCPCVGPVGGIDAVYNGAFNVSSTTTGACDDNTLRAGYDRTYQFNVTCAGNYNISLCGGATWDTYLFLSSGVNSGVISSNDDFCSLQSQISANLSAGTYYVTVEAFSSTTTGAFTLNVTGTDTPAGSASASNVSCNGGSNGSITVSATGGNGLTYSLNGGAAQSSNVFSGLAAGAYNVVVANCQNNSTTISASVSQPALLTASSSADAILCNGGTADVTVNYTGGTAPYSGIGVVANVGAGTYNYVVTDANGCSANTSITVTEPDLLVATATAPAIACNGGQTPLSISATGGTGSYSPSGSNLIDLGAGYYEFTVTDDNGCEALASIDITEPTALVVSNTTSDFNGFGVSCNGGSNGSVNVSATGGTTPYSGNGNNAGLSAGNYNYTVTDANGCSASTSATISEPTVLVASNTISDFNGYGVSCNGGSNGSANVSATGGVTPYSGDGNNAGLSAGNYNYTVTDANGCSASTSATISEPTVLVASTSTSNFNGFGVSCNGGSNGSADVSATGGVTPYSGNGNNAGLSAGNYNYTVTDANGCSSNTSATISQPTALVASTSTSNFNGFGVSCNGGANGSANVSATGGVTPYSGNGNNAGLSAGNYNYTVTDANGCSSNTSATISQPTALVATSSVVSAILCNGGNATVNVSATGGVTAYSGNGNYTVGAGSYNYTVTDANGCSASTSIVISQPTAVSANAGSNAVVYYGYLPMSCTTLSGSGSGGTGSLIYSWSNGTNGANNTVCPSTSSTYTLTATDANGCVATDEVNVCSVNVICFAGKSNVQKVEVCHNGNSICIDANGVMAHLAHGCTLGSCAEVNACSNLSSRALAASSDETIMSEIKLFPNPAKENLQISISNFDEMGSATFTIVNAIGQEVYTGTLNSNETSINISTLSSGVYYFKTNASTAKPVIFVVQ